MWLKERESNSALFSYLESGENGKICVRKLKGDYGRLVAHNVRNGLDQTLKDKFET